MSEDSLEVFDTRVVWELPGVEAAYGCEDELGLLCANCVCCEVANGDLPDRARLYPVQAFNSLCEMEVLVNVVLPRQALPVVADLGALGKFLRPLCVRIEG